jgi:group II intron reverse transcriptase/maturase
MRQKSIQLALNWEDKGEARVNSGRGIEVQTASTTQVSLAHDLMEAVVAAGNMRSALRKVRSNKGSPGVDGMTVEQLGEHLMIAWPKLRENLLADEYKPSPIRRVDIPKPDGGTRQLGIPTVVDRLVQQALLQVLEPLYDPTFSPNSYGFRPGKSAHQALEAAKQHVAAGYNWVVDMDLEKFFDRVNHDILMGRLARRIGDKRVLRLIRHYLQAGIMVDGVVMPRDEGTPQGGPLSPLLANILLDDLDKDLEQRGHRFCRYADDCNIYVQSERAGQRVMASVTEYLERKLKLRVNQDKSAVARPKARKFLGQRVLGGSTHTYLGIHPKSVLRAKKRIRLTTKRNRGASLEQVLRELGQFTNGWVNYHRYTRCSTLLKQMDEWIRRRLRVYIWKQWKTWRNRGLQMRKLGVPRFLAYGVAHKNEGPWKSAGTAAMTRAFPNARFTEMGFRSLHERYVKLNPA